MKKILIIVFVLIIIVFGLYFLNPSLFDFLHQKTTFETVSMSVNDFKKMCNETGGEYKDLIFVGAGQTRNITCGYDKASDADRLCKSEDKANSCVFCKYGAACGLAAGDFGPEHCRCKNYKTIKYLSAESTPRIGQ